MSQLQLAAAMGDRYDRSMIGHAEHNRSALLLDGAVSAARALRVSLDYLAGLVDDPTPADVLVSELAAYRETGGEHPPPLSVGRLLLALKAAEGALKRASRPMDPAEKADFVVMIYMLDASGAVSAEAALGMLPADREEDGGR